MVSPICLETGFRLGLHLLKFGANHLFITAIVILFYFLIKRLSFLAPLFADLLNYVNDFSFLGFIFSFSGWLILLLGVPFAILGMFIVGLIWALVLLDSNFDLLTKLICFPFYFIFGAAWTILNIPYATAWIPLFIIIYLGINSHNMVIKYIFLLLPFAIFIGLPIYLSWDVCTPINSTLKILEGIEYHGFFTTIFNLIFGNA